MRVAELQLLCEISRLKHFLCKAILETHRTRRTIVDHDPAGSTFEIDWTDEVKLWAKMCDLDLSKHDPSFYDR